MLSEYFPAVMVKLMATPQRSSRQASEYVTNANLSVGKEYRYSTWTPTRLITDSEIQLELVQTVA